MNCPFYGKHAVVIPEAQEGKHSSGGFLVDQGGNQCAIITRSCTPCMMEVSLGVAPDAHSCELLRAAALLGEFYALQSRRARKFATDAAASEPRPTEDASL